MNTPWRRFFGPRSSQRAVAEIQEARIKHLRIALELWCDAHEKRGGMTYDAAYKHAMGLLQRDTGQR